MYIYIYCKEPSLLCNADQLLLICAYVHVSFGCKHLNELDRYHCILLSFIVYQPWVRYYFSSAHCHFTPLTFDQDFPLCYHPSWIFINYHCRYIIKNDCLTLSVCMKWLTMSSMILYVFFCLHYNEMWDVHEVLLNTTERCWTQYHVYLYYCCRVDRVSHVLLIVLSLSPCQVAC